MDVNAQVCSVLGQRLTLIERSSGLRSVAVTGVLLRHGAHVHKSYEQKAARASSLDSYGALEHAVRKTNPVKSTDPTLLHMLLRAGANVPTAASVLQTGHKHSSTLQHSEAISWSYKSSLK